MKDLTGQTFGELTAIKPTKDRYFKYIVWECKCSCGKTCYVPSLLLQSGNKKSCGHINDNNLQGIRFSRLVALRPFKNKLKNTQWLCRCDCGGIAIVASKNLKTGNTQSCGCLSKRKSSTYAKCPACGNRFPIVLNGNRTPQFCESCTPKYAKRAWRICPICKKLFPAPPSSNAVTCSKKCSAQWKSIVHKNQSNKWSDESKAKLSARGQTENLKLGSAAARISPISGRFETNQEAKVWTLIDPTGREIVVRNLLLWARKNTALFGKEPGDKSAIQIASGFKAIAQTLTGKRGIPGKASGALTYFGWGLKKPPEEPTD